MIRVSSRTDPSRGTAAGVTVSSLLAGILLASLLFAALGVNPAQALARIFSGSFGSVYGLGETVTKAIPLMLIGAGLAVALRGKLWNIGAEGQLLAGAVCATAVALRLKDSLPAPLMIPLLFAAGAAGGALCGALSGWLKTRWNVNEVISTLMLNYILAELVQFLVYGPWKGTTQFGFPYTDNFAVSATLPCLGPTRIHWPTLLAALLACAASAFLLFRTRFGFETRACGGNPEAARYAGLAPDRTAVLLMAFSGALAGMAGVGEVAGIHKHLSYPWAISSGYGYTAILAAWIAAAHPLLVIPSSLLLGGILVGGDAIQTSMGLPGSAISVFNGILLLAMAGGEFFLRYRVSMPLFKVRRLSKKAAC
ncbi:MAG: ABC transporter permease [Elusimicrobiota bacterium]